MLSAVDNWAMLSQGQQQQWAQLSVTVCKSTLLGVTSKFQEQQLQHMSRQAPNPLQLCMHWWAELSMYCVHSHLTGLHNDALCYMNALMAKTRWPCETGHGPDTLSTLCCFMHYQQVNDDLHHCHWLWRYAWWCWCEGANVPQRLPARRLQLLRCSLPAPSAVPACALALHALSLHRSAADSGSDVKAMSHGLDWEMHAWVADDHMARRHMLLARSGIFQACCCADIMHQQCCRYAAPCTQLGLRGC